MHSSLHLPNKKFVFGIPEYFVPKTKLPQTIKLAKFLPSKRTHYIDIIKKSKEFIPPPDSYQTQQSWIKKTKELEFSKLPRMTQTDQAIKLSPRTPGPGSYNAEKNKIKLGNIKMTLKRELGFINEAEYKGKESPL